MVQQNAKHFQNNNLKTELLLIDNKYVYNGPP